MTLLVLAAGMGSRYGGLKQMDPMGPDGEVVLDYSVYDAIQSGFTKLVLVIRPDMEEQFRAVISPRFANRIEVAYAHQTLDDLPDSRKVPAGRQKPWGTGHAVWAARRELTSPFLAINADDFYGRSAFASMASYLQKMEEKQMEPPEFSLVGYRLGGTISPHGTVSRGICRAGMDGRLSAITEMTVISWQDGVLANREKDAPACTLTGEETASMNFWGFSAAFLPLLEERFQIFLSSVGDNSQAEFYLPYAVTDLISAGKAKVRVLPGGEKWFGVTYPADKVEVTRELQALIEAGEYPDSLWR